MTFAAEWNDREARRDMHLEAMKEAAEDVLNAAADCGWLTEEQVDTALNGSTLHADVVRLLSKYLEDYAGECRGIWPSLPAKLLRAFDALLELDEDAARIDAKVRVGVRR